MKLTNQEIYIYTQNLNGVFTDKTKYLPAKINFRLQKNAQTLSRLAQEIEEERIKILRHYGKETEEGNITIPQENITAAQEELTGLFNIEQEVNILTVNIDALGDLEFSMEQMNALMFMIEGE